VIAHHRSGAARKARSAAKKLRYGAEGAFLYRQTEVFQSVANVVRGCFLSDRSCPARPDLLGERLYV
jgi:hypothetical protein